MTLYDLPSANRLYQSLRLWTFPHTDPQFLEFQMARGKSLRISCSMVELRARREVGVLELDEWTSGPPPEATIHVLARRVRLRSFTLLTSPMAMKVSAAIMKLDIGELRVAAGVMPCTLSVELGSRKWGSSEFKWAEYSRAHL